MILWNRVRKKHELKCVLLNFLFALFCAQTHCFRSSLCFWGKKAFKTGFHLMLCKRNYLCNYTIEYQCCIFKSLILWHWNSWPVFIKCCFFFHINIFHFFSLLLAQMSDEILFKKDEFKNIYWHWKLYFIDFFLSKNDDILSELWV